MKRTGGHVALGGLHIWQKRYRSLRQAVAAAMSSMSVLDLTEEIVTHRFTARSREAS